MGAAIATVASPGVTYRHRALYAASARVGAQGISDAVRQVVGGACSARRQACPRIWTRQLGQSSLFAWLVRRGSRPRTVPMLPDLRPGPVDVARDGQMAVLAMGVETLKQPGVSNASVRSRPGAVVRGFVPEHVTRCTLVGGGFMPIVESVSAHCEDEQATTNIRQLEAVHGPQRRCTDQRGATEGVVDSGMRREVKVRAAGGLEAPESMIGLSGTT
jgi:hypothetical protein